MMPMIRPLLASSRPPTVPGGAASISLTARRRSPRRTATSTSVTPPQVRIPTRPMMPSTIAVVADGCLGGGGW